MESSSIQKSLKKASTSNAITKAKNLTKNKSAAKTSIIEKFNDLGAYVWLNMESMEKNKYYQITNASKSESKFGERLLVELDGQAKLYLPERYNTFSDRQLSEIGNGNYNIINHGKEGKIYKLELVKREDLPSHSTTPPPLTVMTTDETPASPEMESQTWDEADDSQPPPFNPANYFLVRQ